MTPILMSIGSVRFAGDAHIHEQTAPQFASEATRVSADVELTDDGGAVGGIDGDGAGTY